MKERIEIASRVLAGFAANPSVFAPNPTCGWGLVNTADHQLAAYALQLADRLIDADRAMPERQNDLIRFLNEPHAHAPKEPSP